MKHKLLFIFLGLIFLSGLTDVLAQHLPFQGKLLENGQPVNGMRAFTFSINQGVINWSETHPNVPINNGLYAVILGSITPLPANLFNGQTVLNLYIAVNGVPLDTVPLYPPIESDPTVPATIKDGITWNEIGNVPPDILNDTSPTNELQSLGLNDQVLSISSGNSIVLPQSDLPEQISFTQPDTTDLSCPVQTTSNPPNQELIEVWQSFTACYNGLVAKIYLQFSNLYQTNIKLTFYPGEGTSGQPIHEQVFASNLFPATLQLQEFILSPPIPVSDGSTYTFKISGLSNPVSISSAGSNPYTGGKSSLGNDKDLKFEIINQVNNSFSMHIAGALTGDNWGVIPSGGIIMWSGSIASIPDGWALCDGTSGTPDLRDRFIVGAKTDEGGQAKTEVSGLLTQTGGTSTINMEHNHGGSTGGAVQRGTDSSVTFNTMLTHHQHNISNSLSSNQTILNPYYALAFIMKL